MVEIEEYFQFDKVNQRKLGFLTGLIVLIFTILVVQAQFDLSSLFVSSDYSSNGSGFYTQGENSFMITDTGVYPGFKSISKGTEIRFKNNLTERVTINFDSSNRQLKIRPLTRKKRVIDSTTSFTVRGEGEYRANGRLIIE